MSDLKKPQLFDDQKIENNLTEIKMSDTEINSYTLKINSKSRNIIREPNPFNFELGFNNNQNTTAMIPSNFNNIKKIQIAQILIPRFIPRDYMGEPINGVTPIYDTSTTVILSYYPGINLNNTVIAILDIYIEVIELVDLNLKRTYLIALEYNNPYYTSKINIKADLFSYININNNIYPITKIIGSLLTLGNTDNYPLPLFTNNRLIIGDFYKNIITIDTPETHRIAINTNNIYLYNSNYLIVQFVFPKQYLEFQVNSNLATIIERKLFKINTITKEKINKNISDESLSNTVIIINGIWTEGIPSMHDTINPQTFNYNNIIKLSQFNYGVRDLLDEKIFYLNVHPFVPNKIVSTEIENNDSFGVFFPSTQSKDYLFLRGDAFESYTLNNLKNTNSKIKFTLLDSNYDIVGDIYNTYPTLYQPNILQSIKSYLLNIPDITIIMKIEEIERKNIMVPSFN